MTFVELRNSIVKLLWQHLGVPVILSDQVSPEVGRPFCVYSVITPYVGTGEIGDISTVRVNSDSVDESRLEMPSATFSFTFCSINRTGEDGEEISGADEAAELADRAVAWFYQLGYDDFLKLGICITDVGQVQDRTMLVIDEADRRMGFDVRIRYTRVDTRRIGTILDTTFTSKGAHI